MYASNQRSIDLRKEFQDKLIAIASTMICPVIVWPDQYDDHNFSYVVKIYEGYPFYKMKD